MPISCTGACEEKGSLTLCTLWSRGCKGSTGIPLQNRVRMLFIKRYMNPSWNKRCAFSEKAPRIQSTTNRTLTSLLQQRSRLALRRLRDHPQASPEVSVAAGNCKEATKVVRRIKRRLYHARQAALVAEVAEAWRKKDFATAWKVSRILAGKNIGPKRRQMAAPATPLFDKSEWLHVLAQQGPQRGCGSCLQRTGCFSCAGT